MNYDIVCGMLFFMSIGDILWKKIPNLLVLIYIIIGSYTYRGDFIFRFTLSILILSFLYSIRLFGAGDVKLFSLLIAFLGLQEGINVAILSLLLAGAYSLVYMIFTKQLFSRIFKFVNYCFKVFSTGKIDKYMDFNSESRALIPMAPFFLTGFLLWRCFC